MSIEVGSVLEGTVTGITNFGAFVELTGGKVGLIHISEVAPGRIRNIREFVSEGKKIICMILRVKKEREQYDLSLRRVQVNKRRINHKMPKQFRGKTRRNNFCWR